VFWIPAFGAFQKCQSASNFCQWQKNGFQFCPTRHDLVFIGHPKTPKILPVNIVAHFWKAPKAGIQNAHAAPKPARWIPAFAGMTEGTSIELTVFDFHSF
jgi:hypothetical protein